jgi:quercetin dioxygenase-like cupin family protein
MAEKVEPYTLAREEGRPFWFLDTLIYVKATGEKTGGALGLIEQVLPAGSETSYHVHHAEDEYWYVLEGQVTFISEERRIEAAAGSFVFMPRDIPHGLRTRTSARMLVFSTPPGFVDFAIEMSQPANKFISLPDVLEALPRRESNPNKQFSIDPGHVGAGVKLMQDRPAVIVFWG